uniref:Gelsolin-like domain-containing protein n=1 Tax=Rhabditophanes sp. KR3021 TaxID=114890 RepID=A0AC35UFK3_9BILA
MQKLGPTRGKQFEDVYNDNRKSMAWAIHLKIRTHSFFNIKMWYDRIIKSNDFLYVWEIAKFNTGKYAIKSADNIGSFFESYNYIVLKINSEVEYKYDIHVWLGSKSSSNLDNITYKAAICLDTKLEHKTRLYREEQGRESTLFLSHFSFKIRYDSSPISNVKEFFPTSPFKVYRVNTTDNYKVTRVISNIKMLNHRDVYVFDLGLKIAIWFAPKSNQISHKVGIHVASIIKNAEKNRNCVMEIFSQNWLINEVTLLEIYRNNMSEYMNDLGDSLDEINEERFCNKIFVYNVSYDNKSITIKQNRDKPNFDSNKMYLINNKNIVIYIWIGKNVSFRKVAFNIGTTYIRGIKLPSYTSILCLNQDYEPDEFKRVLNFIGT